MVLLLLSSNTVGFFFLQNFRDAGAQSGSGAGSEWVGEYESFHREEAAAQGMSFLSEEKESGTISFTIDSMGKVSGTGTGHFYESLEAPCRINGDSAYTFSFVGVVYGANFDDLELGTYRTVNPETFTITYTCPDGSSLTGEDQLVPLTFSGCCLIPRIIMKLENASTFHYYNSVPEGDTKTTTSVDITIHVPTCAATFKGAFEPVQAVWQDDDLFPDRQGKQLTKLDDRHYTAELGMVSGKQSLLSGIKGDRYNIHLDGQVRTTVNVPATVRFNLEDSAGKRILYQYDAGQLPLEGPCGQEQQVSVKIPAPHGIPDQAFTFGGPGPYHITMELVEANGKVVKDSQVVVEGNILSMKSLKVSFIPAFLGQIETDEQAPLVASAQDLATLSAEFIPDYYPLGPGSMTTKASPVAFSLSHDIEQASSLCNGSPTCVHDKLPALITKDATLIGWIGGIDRVFIVLTDAEFTAAGADPGELGETFSSKVIFLNEATLGVSRANAVVAHELVHSLPFPWSSGQMISECGVAYHGPKVPNYGNGFQVTNGGAFSPAPVESVGGIMGPAERAEWIEQCTYWHLLAALNSKSDPTVLGVRGWVSNSTSGEVLGGFDPGYTLQGEPDLNGTGTGNYALVFKGPGDNVLSRYNFNVTTSGHEGYQRKLVEFGYRVIMPEGAIQLDLVGPGGGILASNLIPSGSPSVRIIAPAEGSTAESSVPLIARWEGVGSSLIYSVFVSPDSGKSWNPMVIDTNSTSTSVDLRLLSPGKENVLQVVATDGFHSQASFLHFALPAAAENQTGTGPTPTSPPKSGCLIATAAFGSELAPQVQFLRTFRDERILSTISGSSFMNVFNAWYYSFSPQVADYERSQPWMQQTVRVMISPLLAILQLAEKSYDVVPGEYGSLFAGLVASSLIGLVYFTPFALAVKAVTRGMGKSLHLEPRIAIAIIISLSASVICSIAFGSTIGTMITTSALVLSTLSIAAIYGAKMVSKIHGLMP